MVLNKVQRTVSTICWIMCRIYLQKCWESYPTYRSNSISSSVIQRLLKVRKATVSFSFGHFHLITAYSMSLFVKIKKYIYRILSNKVVYIIICKINFNES